MLCTIKRFARRAIECIKTAWRTELVLHAMDKDIDAPADPKKRAVRERYWQIQVRKAERGDAAIVLTPQNTPAVVDTADLEGVGGVGVAMQAIEEAASSARCTCGDYEALPPPHKIQS